MTKYVLALNKHPFSSNLRSVLANTSNFSVLAILKQNKQMKIKSNNKHRGMHVDRELTKTSLQTKKKVSESFSPEYFLPFSFQWKFFFSKHATRENGLKGLVRSRVVDQKRAVMLYSCIAIGGYGPAGSFQIWYDATTPHLQEDHGGWSFRCVLAGMLCWRQMSKFQLRLYARHLWAEQPNQGGQTRGLCSEPWEILL